MFKIFYSALLFILHSVVDIFEILCDIWVYIKFRIIYPNDSINQFYDVTNRTKLLRKLPKHVTVLLGTENPSYKDLTNIVLWSIAAGIPFISFYDCKGLLKMSEMQFEVEVENTKNTEDHIIWHDNPKSNYKNGYVGRKVHVKVLSPSDGRAQFAEVCKKLSKNEKAIDMKCIDCNLRVHYEFPDPDLAIYCGRTLSLYDYPPWQISVTEFLNIKSHHNLHHTNFIDLLSRYSKCEQRLGK